MLRKLKISLLIVTLLILSLIMICCGDDKETNKSGSDNQNTDNNASDDTSSVGDAVSKTDEKEDKLKIGLAVSTGGLNDNSFNQMQYTGLINLTRQFPDKVEIVYKELSKDFTNEDVIRHLAEDKKCDLIIGAGWENIEPMNKLASKHPETHFVLLDDYAIPQDNVTSVIFAQNEGSFVVGALSALMTETKKIGFVGGVNQKVIEDFRIGFEEGIHYVDPSTELYTEYCSLVEDNDWSGWENPQKAKEIADKMYNETGVDVIYAVAGLSGNGVIQSARENKKYVIGVDSNQDHLAKGLMLTSMMKRLDKAVFDIGKKFVNGDLKGNEDYLYGYNNEGVSITEMEFTKDLVGEENIKKLKEIEEKIKKSEINVTRVLKREK